MTKTTCMCCWVTSLSKTDPLMKHASLNANWQPYSLLGACNAPLL